MKDIFKSEKKFILGITLAIFSLCFIFDISTIIIYTMSFLILMEVVRTIYEYITNPHHRIKMRYVIDGAILFGIRELFVGWVMLKTDLTKGIFIMGLSILSVGILIWYRKIVIKNSPDFIERCSDCIKIKKEDYND